MDEDEGDQFQDDQTGELTETQKENIADIYKRFDLDGNGILTKVELRKGLQFLGLNPTKEDIKRIMAKNNFKDKKISYEEFEQIIKDEILGRTDPGFDLLEAFRIFDKDKNGKLNKRELAYALRSLGEKLSDEEISELFKTLDTDKDGELNYLEAARLLA